MTVARLQHFGTAAHELLSQPEPERARWAAAARERVERDFGPAQEAEALSRVLERLMPSAS